MRILRPCTRPSTEWRRRGRGASMWLALVLLWSYQDLTADRLLLNITWSIWVIVGTVLEERDLVAQVLADRGPERRGAPPCGPGR